MCGPGSASTSATDAATSDAATGEVRPSPNGSRMAPEPAMDRAARLVNSGLSRNAVGRTCTTGSADRSSTCSDSQCSRCWCDSWVLSACICDTVIWEMATRASRPPTARATVATVAAASR